MKNNRTNNTPTLNRREFIGITFGVPMLGRTSVSKLGEPVKMGLISDLHHDLIHDGKNRLAAFLADSRQAEVDGVMQMGDFIFPDEKNQDVIDLFNQAHEWMSRVCAYQNPLYTVMTIDPATMTIQVTGKQSTWVGASPTELGFTDEYKPLKVGEEIVPFIRKRAMKARKG